MPNRLNTQSFWLARYGAALAAAAAGFVVRLILTALAGEGLPTYITF